MAIAESERLRQLVSDYYHGLITSDSYRKRRRQLLDNIGDRLGDDSDSTATRPKRDKQPAEPAAPAPPVAEVGKSSSRYALIATAAVIVIAVIVVGYIALGLYTDTNRTAGQYADEEVVTFGAGLDRGVNLVEEFLSRSDWKNESLGNFSLAWEALDDVQRVEATGSRQYRRLTMLLHRRIREQLALDAGDSNEQIAALTEFAATIGAPYRQTQVAVSDEAPKVEIVKEMQVEAEPAAEEPEESSDTEAIIENLTVEEEQVETVSPAAAESETPVDTETQAEKDDPCPPELANTRRPYCQDMLANGEKGPALVVLPNGIFRMGSDESPEESPPHDVEIAYHFAMSRYEITAHEYRRFCGATSLPCPEQRWQDDAPVVSVDWDDAVSYVEWLSESTGFDYRLPTEAEWEYAARAGTDTPYFFGDEITPSAAHSSENGSADSPLPVEDRVVNRNPFRLYHMSGNVREWVQDAWHPDYQGAPSDGSPRKSEGEDERVVRGGSYKDPATRLRSAAREPLARAHRDEVTGIRIVREIKR